jgi:hypothetical protein
VNKPVVDTIPPIEVTYQKDLFLVRTSKNGDELWKESFGSAEDESVLHATEMISSGGFMLAGYQKQDGKTDILIMGVTDQGDSIKLGFNYPNPNSDNASANYILNTGDKYLAACTYNKVGTEGTDILLLYFDDELSATDRIIDEGSNEIGQSILHDDSNKYLVLGNREDETGYNDIIVHQIETGGEYITNSRLLATISQPNTDLFARRFVKTEDGRLAIVGTRQTNGNRDIFLQFMDAEYQVGDLIIFGSAGDQSGSDIEVPVEGGLVLLGTNGSVANSMISLIRTGDVGDL